MPIGTEDKEPPRTIVSDPDCVTRQDPQVEGVPEFAWSLSRSTGLTHKAALLIVEPAGRPPAISKWNKALRSCPTRIRPAYTLIWLPPLVSGMRSNKVLSRSGVSVVESDQPSLVKIPKTQPTIKTVRFIIKFSPKK